MEVVYGQRFRKGDVLAFLRGRVGGQTDDGGMGAGFGGWKDAVRDLKAALLGGEILLVDS